MKLIRCSQCGMELNKRALFCLRCGNLAVPLIALRCPVCAMTIFEGDRYCTKCGRPVKPESKKTSI
ncbi:MAG TPA: zinc ribbon domain-containing protein [Syntrophomonadaceae bacterium]|nr:zinc ribbon domain-containing protein [Syntrophomonadaceae bacterium]